MKITLILLLVMLLVSCGPPPAYTLNTRPPGGAMNMKNVMNGWYTFEWQGECFLMKTGGQGSAMIGHITTISCGEEDEN